MTYGRQNSDQTAYLRNMRSVLQQTAQMHQKNNFITSGNQQLSQFMQPQSQQHTTTLFGQTVTQLPL